MWTERLRQYALLMRLDRPIGSLLLLWPALWALWLAGEGHPRVLVVVVFEVVVLVDVVLVEVEFDAELLAFAGVNCIASAQVLAEPEGALMVTLYVLPALKLYFPRLNHLLAFFCWLILTTFFPEA